MSTVDVYDVADFFLSKKALTPKKIQKLVYYAYAWFIALNNQDVNEIENVLFQERPEAWIHGPVFPSLYQKYKKYNWNEIEKGKKVKFQNEDLQCFLEDIWDKFGKFSADELEYMTHQEFPWINARRDSKASQSSSTPLSLKDIFVYYNGLIDVT